MNKKLKNLSLVLAIIMICSFAISGCKSTKKAPTDTTTDVTTTEVTTEATTEVVELKPVELVMYLLGDPAKEYDLALEQLNIKMKADINATLKVNWLSWGEFSTKYPLVLASGEPMDLIYTADWSFFSEQAQKGAFIPLDEIGPQYAPQSFKEEPENGLKQATINGKIYCLPMDYPEYNTWGYIVRGDLMKKAGMTEIKSLDDFGKYLDYVAKNEPGMMPLNFSKQDGTFGTSLAAEQGWLEVAGGTNLSVKFDDPEAKVFLGVNTPEYESHLKKMQTWSENGYWSKSALSNDVTAFESFKNGKSASAMWNLLSFNQAYIALNATNPEWDVQFFDAYPLFSTMNKYTANAMAIPIASQNPERALMLLEKLRNDETYFNLLTYGIEGKHYNITSEGYLEALDTENFGPDSSCPWGFRVEKFYKDYKGSWPGLSAYRDAVKSRLIESPLAGFVMNTENIKAELANIANVNAQYGQALNIGLADIDEYLPQYKDKLIEAGQDKVMQEVQSQINEFLKTK